jgi:hypothetical protein
LRSAFLECGGEFGKIDQPSLQRVKEEFRLRLSLSHAQTRSRPGTKSWSSNKVAKCFRINLKWSGSRCGPHLR